MSSYERSQPCTAVELLFKLVLTGWQSHYENRGIFDEKRMLHLKEASKQVLEKTQRAVEVRKDLGYSLPVWQHMTDVLAVAIPVIEQLCFVYKSPNAAQFNGSSSELVAANSFTLINDLERLHDLCIIARNITATTTKAQNYAAESGIDQQVLKLIDICVKVTARGFDGTNSRAETRHSTVCNMFKRVLISCLQFLHNFIMRNEHRKLVLWLDLFGYSQQVENVAAENLSAGISRKDLPVEVADNEIESPSVTRVLNVVEELKTTDSKEPVYNIDDVHALFDLMSMEKQPDERTSEATQLFMKKIVTDMEQLSGLDADTLDGNLEVLLRAGAGLRSQLADKDTQTRPSQERSRPTSGSNRTSSYTQERGGQWSGLPDLSSYGSLLVDQEITEDDLAMPRTSNSAAETLQEAKDELMARLQDTAPLNDDPADQSYDDSSQIVEPDVEDDIPESAEDSIDEEEEDDEDYHNANDQERGLLTDVPLVLGPTEIEALPMIIQAGIVDRFGSQNNGDRQGLKNMQSVRCHILLAQEAGRNVLRELLIFIAAWDLPDDEIYFKMMVQIMEAILKNGLMSHAYSDFGQAKDIISPAQAVVIKILTHIYRAKYSPSSAAQNSDQTPNKLRIPEPLTRTDVLTVRYIFTVFRGNIIPETCALIYLQGQIRAGLAMAEDFPLNLWDMERVYEGVYQFLEFFAVLTENNDWKRLLIQWEIVYDLVTLLKELDASISKAPLNATSMSQARQTTPATQPGATPSTIVQSQPPSATTPRVERPYDPTESPELPPPPPPPPPPPATTTSQPQPANTTSDPSTAQAQSQSQSNSQPEDPSSFEWRNLKKLIVLVLSSLVWKSPTVQRQIRENSGVECILSCTKYDGHNPYIKEHAVMCLKFLLEGNTENQEIVRSLEARGVENQEGLERDFGVRADIQGGRVRVVQNANVGGGGPSGSTQGMRRSMRDRRASESNAAAELLGEKFARLNADMAQGQSQSQNCNQSQSFGRLRRRDQRPLQHPHQHQQGRILGEADADDIEDGEDQDDIDDDNDDDDDDDDDDEIEFM